MILHTSVALLMLFKVPGCREDLITALTIVRFSIYMYRLLVSFQEARLMKGGPTLTTLVLSQSTLVCFEIIWVSVCSFTVITTKPFIFC